MIANKPFPSKGKGWDEFSIFTQFLINLLLKYLHYIFLSLLILIKYCLCSNNILQYTILIRFLNFVALSLCGHQDSKTPGFCLKNYFLNSSYQ